MKAIYKDQLYFLRETTKDSVILERGSNTLTISLGDSELIINPTDSQVEAILLFCEDTTSVSKGELTFPKVTEKEISLYAETIISQVTKSFKSFNNPNSISVESLAKAVAEAREIPLVKFMVEFQKSSMESKVFQNFLYTCKQLLHTHNRTTGLMQAYILGVLIGYFLAKPEALPSDTTKDELENELKN